MKMLANFLSPCFFFVVKLSNIIENIASSRNKNDGLTSLRVNCQHYIVLVDSPVILQQKIGTPDITLLRISFDRYAN